MYRLEPAKSGDSSDTSLEYYTREWKSLLRSAAHRSQFVLEEVAPQKHTVHG